MVTRLGDTPFIQLGDLAMNTGLADTGAIWWGAITSGWDSPPPRPRAIQGELVDGDHWQPGQVAARDLVLSGYAKIVSPSAPNIRAARERFVSAAEIIGTLASLVVTEVVGVTTEQRMLEVYTVDRPQVSFEGCAVMRFAVGLSAPRPDKLAVAPSGVSLAETMPLLLGTTTGSSGAGTTGTVVLPVPAGATTGDVLVACFDLESTTVAIAAAGWTLVATVVYGTRRFAMWRRAAGGAEPASYTWTLTVADEWSGTMVAVRNSDPAVTGTLGTLARATAAANLTWVVTTPAPRSLRVFGAGYSLPATPTSPSTLIERANIATSGGAPDSASYVATSQPGSGVVDPSPVVVALSVAVTMASAVLNLPPVRGAQVVVVGGTAPTSPVLTIVGPSAGPQYVCRGTQCLRFNAVLSSTDIMVVDFGARTVEINGVNRYDVVQPGSRWFSLTPGTNLLPTQQASFESEGAPGWASATLALSRSTDVALVGTASMRVGNAGVGVLTARSAPVPATAGATYSATLSMQPGPGTPARDFACQIVWLNSAGADISVSSSVAGPETVGVWITKTVTAVAPAGAVGAVLQMTLVTGGVAEVHYLDRAGFFAGALPAIYDAREANLIDYAGGGTATLTWREADL